MLPLLALLAVTAVWGVTFVQVKEAIALYPLFAFLALRFAIASAALALPGYRRVGGLGRDGLLAGGFLGLLLAAGFGLQTAGLERTTVSSTGFITGLYVVLTPLLATSSSASGLERSSGPGWRSRSWASRSSRASTPGRRPETCSCSPAPRPRHFRS
jgi:drug/metabolite transporter (DMT)-like permease